MNPQLSHTPGAKSVEPLWVPPLAGEQPNRGSTGPAVLWHLPVRFDYAASVESAEAGSSPRARQPYEFEGLLVDILARFVNLPAEEVEREIEDALNRVCNFLDVDRAGLWRQYGKDAHSLLLMQQCLRLGRVEVGAGRESAGKVESESTEKQPLTLGAELKVWYPWITEEVKRGKAVVLTNTGELPLEARRDRQTMACLGTRSMALIPFLVEGEVLGAVSFEMISREIPWPQPLVKRLEFVAEVFAQAASRTRAEEKLRASEALLRMAAASAGVGLWSLDLKTRRFQTTAKAYELLGLHPGSELSFEQFLALVHPEDRDRVRQTTEEAVRTRGEIDIEFRVVLAAGDLHWVSSRGRCQCNTAGEPERLTGVSSSITARKRAESLLQQSYAEIKQLKDRLQAESDYLKAEIKVKHLHGEIIGRSQGIRHVLHQVEQVAPADCSVLINGETGTGKELIAQEIHRLSARRDHVMVLVNCAALPGALVESELFGRERGAYTGALTSQVGRFEVANGSTIFLDEVGELSMEVQAKLLRVLQTGEFQRLGSPKTHKVDVRVIAATNRDLAQAVRTGRFREDLYYRLRVFPIEIPPLRERAEDIPSLVFAFMEEFASRMGKKITKIPRKGMDRLQAHSWPGNIRELRNVIEHSVILTPGDTLKLTALGELACPEVEPVTLAEAEREHILKTLESTGWRIKGPRGAAARLDLQPSTLYSRMQKLGIPHRRQKDEMSTLG